MSVTRTVEIGGAPIHVAGSGAGPPLLLIPHGFAPSRHDQFVELDAPKCCDDDDPKIAWFALDASG